MRANGENYIRLIREKFHKLSCQRGRKSLNNIQQEKNCLFLRPVKGKFCL
jgi:hypothetical protein